MLGPAAPGTALLTYVGQSEILQKRPGDRVLLIRGEIMDHSPLPKASLPTDGPYTVARRMPHDNYVLTDLHSRRIHNTVHVSRLIPFPDRPYEGSEWMLRDPHTDGVWPVHSVIDRRRPARFTAGDDSDFEYRVHY